MIKKFVLNYIRTHMSHETMHTRDEIFEAINDGCTGAFREDNTQSRLSWMFGEFVKKDKQFMEHLEKGNQVPGWVASAAFSEIDGFVTNHRLFEAQKANYRAKELIRNRI